MGHRVSAAFQTEPCQPARQPRNGCAVDVGKRPCLRTGGGNRRRQALCFLAVNTQTRAYRWQSTSVYNRSHNFTGWAHGWAQPTARVGWQRPANAGVCRLLRNCRPGSYKRLQWRFPLVLASTKDCDARPSSAPASRREGGGASQSSKKAGARKRIAHVTTPTFTQSRGS